MLKEFRLDPSGFLVRLSPGLAWGETVGEWQFSRSNEGEQVITLVGPDRSIMPPPKMVWHEKRPTHKAVAAEIRGDNRKPREVLTVAVVGDRLLFQEHAYE